MSFFDDPNRPQPETDVAENLLTPQTMKKCQVILTWTPNPGHESATPPPTQQRTFLSTSAAQEWILSISHDSRATGSPKQLVARRAALLQITTAQLSQFTPTATIHPLEAADVHTPRRNPNAPIRNPRGDKSSDPAPAASGSLEAFFGGLNPASTVLSSDEIEFLSRRADEAEDDAEI